MRIAFGSDHVGIAGRQAAVARVEQLDAEVIDMGPKEVGSVDYPDFAHRVAAAVESGEVDFGVLVCGTGQGMAMAANRHPGVRAAVITNTFTAQMSRAHNNANIACFGERVISSEKIAELVVVFLTTEFEGDRHSQRVAKIER